MELLWEGLREGAMLVLRGDPELVGIVLLSLVVSLSATTLAAVFGVPAGVALAAVRFPGRPVLQTLVNTGMGLPPVVVGLVVLLLLWRTGPFGPLQLLYTPAAMVLAQLIVAAPLAAGLTRSAIALLDAEILNALRVDGAGALRVGRELVLAASPQVLVAVAAAFGRAIAEVGASLMVGGNIKGGTRILTTALALESSRGNLALAIGLGLALLVLAFGVNAALGFAARAQHA